jgi:transcriptional regulator with XRE-family HTH domain
MPGKNPDPVDIHVGSRIKMQRRIMEMSQTELADAVGLTFQQIQKYENRKNRVSSSRLQQFAAILNVPAPFFFDGAPSPKMKMRKDDEPDYRASWQTHTAAST